MAGSGGHLRIAHVHDIAHVATTLARTQRNRGDHARVFEPWKPGASWPYPWKWFAAPLRAASLLALALRLRTGQWDVVHVHSASHAAAGAWSGLPYVVHCHGSDVRGVLAPSLRGRVVKRFLRTAAFVIYATPDLGDIVRSLRDDAEFLPNPIDVRAFAPGASRDRDLIVGVRLDPIKGATTVIEAAEKILAARPATTMTVIEQGALAGLARARLPGPGVALISPVTHTTLGGVLANHRVALGQFQTGAVGQYELESLACGTVVVCRFEFAGNYRTPVPIVSVGNAAAAAAETVRLLDNDTDLQERSRLSREWVIAEHEASRVAELLSGIYARAGIGRSQMRSRSRRSEAP